MASMPDPVRGDAPRYAAEVRLALSLKGQLVQTFNFDKSEITVGRDPYCDVYVDNPGVSRQHFRISRGDTGEFRVTDLGSSNGTYLNDRPVKVGTLRDGDVIQFGKYSVKFQVDELVGDEAAGPRAHSVAEGATMMLSPAEVRQMVAEARGGAAKPKLAVVGRETAPVPAATAAPSRSTLPGWLPWAVAGVVAVAAAAMLLLQGR